MKFFFKIIAKFNKLIFPSFSKMGIELSSASQFQLIILSWRAYITKRAL
jgi:hypothetical protein